MTVREQYDAMIRKIEQEAGRGDLSASELAERVARENGLGIRDMTAVMRYLTGRTLLDYIRERKLMAACRYLTGGPETTIHQAIAISGYDNQSSFTKRFTAVFGMPNTAVKRIGEGQEFPAVATEKWTKQDGETMFGLPRETFEQVMWASELERMYSLHPAFSQLAFRLYEEGTGEDARRKEKGGRSMEDCFRFLHGIQDVYTVHGEFASEDSPEDLAREADAEYVSSAFYRFMFFQCDITVGTASDLMLSRIMPTEEELMQMDPNMIRAFSLADEYFHLNFFFFRKAYQYFQEHGAGIYGNEEFFQYLDLLDQNVPIEIAFANIVPEMDAEEVNDAMEEAWREMQFEEQYEPDSFWEEQAAEEERWHDVILDLDLDEENREYEMEDLLDPGPLDFWF